ncbi:outer membrane protein assembly factor BamD [Orrella daihaiensis]|uniref:Outer membrane protein assembly factor BamD n=2 Tax=Orrella daihaiensis TaxID=2782176 RepID=A0ABY4ANU2_9BURK|nr:outer membrane protein assembly factor BamD [Orrella daihaiensis]UOD51648.1 outer membrane protein assembly factor BamD [Orrella daihaiensis]
MLLLIMFLALSGCSSFGEDEYDETAGWSVERLYQDGKEEMNAGNWTVAAERFTAVEARYPFGPFAQQSLINLAYVQWKQSEPEMALATISRFQRQYPNHPGSDYMLFLRGLILFTPPSSRLAFLSQQDPAERDPRALRESYAAFEELITRFPQSRYAEDARQRMNWLVNTMAEHQVHAARFYYERQGYVAAINRAQSVLTDYEGVPATEEALYIIMMSYQKLDMPDMSKDAERVLLANFPNTQLIAKGLPKPTYSWWNPLGYF